MSTITGQNGVSIYAGYQENSVAIIKDPQFGYFYDATGEVTGIAYCKNTSAKYCYEIEGQYFSSRRHEDLSTLRTRFSSTGVHVSQPSEPSSCSVTGISISIGKIFGKSDEVTILPSVGVGYSFLKSEVYGVDPSWSENQAIGYYPLHIEGHCLSLLFSTKLIYPIRGPVSALMGVETRMNHSLKLKYDGITTEADQLTAFLSSLVFGIRYAF